MLEMKNEKNYMGFLIHKVRQILKRFSRALGWAQTSYLWAVYSIILRSFWIWIRKPEGHYDNIKLQKI